MRAGEGEWDTPFNSVDDSYALFPTALLWRHSSALLTLDINTDALPPLLPPPLSPSTV